MKQGKGVTQSELKSPYESEFTPKLADFNPLILAGIQITLNFSPDFPAKSKTVNFVMANADGIG